MRYSRVKSVNLKNRETISWSEKRVVRFLSDFTAQISFFDEAIVSVISLRKRSIFEIERERYSLSASKRMTSLVKCHVSKLESWASLCVYVNSLARKKTANARQYAACNVICDWSTRFKFWMRRRSMSLMMRRRSLLSISSFFRLMSMIILFSIEWWNIFRFSKSVFIWLDLISTR